MITVFARGMYMYAEAQEKTLTRCQSFNIILFKSYKSDSLDYIKSVAQQKGLGENNPT